MKSSIKKTLIFSCLIFGLLIFVGAKESKEFQIGKGLEMLINTFRDLHVFYVDDVDSEELLSDAINGMTKGLDPYTEYIPASEMSNFEFMTTGKYGGIGAIIRKKGDYVVISQPYRDTPSDKVGLKIGDKLLEIDGVSGKGMGISDVSSRLKGDPGTQVKVKVEHFATGTAEDLTITREKISISGIPFYGFVSDSIGYIKHSEFTEGCYEDMLNAFMTLKSSGKLKGLILDYRNNGGGILQEAVKVLSIFTPKDTEVVSMRGKNKKLDKIFKTNNTPKDLEIPIVTLINNASASAAEIVSGAIQDLDRGVLMGQRTFGKGLVQSTRPLGYNSYLKLTTAKYYIPSGRCIQAIDYTHRNEDGSVGFIPDSLVTEFSTKGGRKVYDGGGVAPDVKIEPKYFSRFVAVLYGKGYLDDFIDDYRRRNPEAVDCMEFQLTDDDYTDFVAFIEDKDLEFESESKRTLKKLIESAKKERFYDNIETQLKYIETHLTDDKENSLKTSEQDIREMLENDIVLRDHYADGVTRRKVSKDREVLLAIELLNDTDRYQDIIENQDTSRK